MALSNITVKGLTPDLSVLGAYQRFHFTDDAVIKLQSFNAFAPVNILNDSENNIELRNYLLSGYRFHQLSHFDELSYPGTFKFQHFTNDGAGVDIFTYDGAYFSFNVPVQFAPLGGDLDMGGFRIINLGDPVDPDDGATKAYVDAISGGGTLTLTGDITATGTLGTPIATTLTLTLDQIPLAASAPDLNSQKIINLAAPTAAGDATNKGYVDGKTWTSSQITDFTAAVTAFRLDQFAAPTTAVSMNSNKITNLATPTASGDAATKGYVDTLPSYLDVNYYPLGSNTFQNFRFAPMGSSFGLVNEFVATSGNPSQMDFNFTNSNLYGFRINHITTFGGGSYGVWNFQAVDSSNVATTLLSLTDTTLAVSVPTVFYDALVMNSSFINMSVTNKIINLAAPTAAGDATNKGYVDGKTWTTSQITNFNASVTAFRLDQFAVPTSAISMNSQKITSLATPTAGGDGTNKTYVDGKTWTTSQITNFNASVTAFRLDQFAAPTASVNLNSRKIINLATPTASGDAATKGYVDTLPASLDVNYYPLGSNTFQNFRFAPMGSSFGLVNEFSATSGNPSQMDFNFTNSNLSGFRLNHTTTFGAGPFGVLNFQSVNSSNVATTLLSLTDTTLAVSVPTVFYDALVMNSSFINMSVTNKIINLAAPTAAGDATNKSYVDTTALYAKRSAGTVYMQSNATITTVTANTWEKILGSTLLSSNSYQFTMPSNNRITYVGTGTISAMVFVATDLILTAPAYVVSICVYKNGVQVIPSLSTRKTTYSATPESVYAQSGVISLSNGDYLEAWVRVNNSTDVTVSNLSVNVITV